MSYKRCFQLFLEMLSSGLVEFLRVPSQSLRGWKVLYVTHNHAKMVRGLVRGSSEPFNSSFM